MFEISRVDQWLSTPLQPIVREGLLATNPTASYPGGLSERLEAGSGDVITGQQPGFGGGPLYSTYKRWSCDQIAQKSGTQSIFWVEAGDSDWYEIAKIDTDHEHFQWPDETPGVPVGDRPMPHNLSTRLAVKWKNVNTPEIAAALTGTVRGSFQAIHKSCDSTASNTRWLDGPPFLDNPHPIIAEWLERLPEGVVALKQGIERVTNTYGTPQAALLENRTGWFYVADRNAVRQPVIMLPDHLFAIGEHTYEAAELAAMQRSGIGYFIPGALWRTLLQQSLCNPAQVVVGTSEAAYWGEVAELFQWAGLAFPKLVIRQGMTILPAKLASIQLSEIDQTEPPPLPEVPEWQQLASDIRSLKNSLDAVGVSLPVHLKEAIQKGNEKVQYQLQRIEEIGKKYLDETAGNRQKRWEQARQYLYGTTSKPPQERWMTLLEAWCRWGSNGISELNEIVRQNEGGRIIVKECERCK